MILRFRRSLRIAPGVRLNLGLRGASLSVRDRLPSRSAENPFGRSAVLQIVNQR
jgi:hypothetical protein